MQASNAGIYSLAGFAYQIKVFILSLARTNQDQKVEYETLDDVVVRQDSDLDEMSDKILCRIGSGENFTAIQVKKANVGDPDSFRIFYNWLIAYNRAPINKFVVYYPSGYTVSENVFGQDANQLFQTICASRSRSDALISQVKALYKSKKEKFLTDFQFIKNNYLLKEVLDIDLEIHQALSTSLHAGVSSRCYSTRVFEIVKRLSYYVLDSISHGNPYTCSYQEFMGLCDQVCQDITNDIVIPNFSAFQNALSLDIFSPEIAGSREYRQLKKCGLQNDRVKTHLIYKLYYEDIKFHYLDNNRLLLVNDIELTSYENFITVKEQLISENNDSPNKRLCETKRCANTYVINDQSKWGSYISLTKESTDEDRKISWEDE